MNIEEQKKYYDAYWLKREKQNFNKYRRMLFILTCLKKILQNNRDLKVADLGCGDGWLAGILGHFVDMTGYELSPLAIETAQKSYPYVLFKQANVLEYDFFSNQYDVVISQEVIEHVWEQDKYLNQIFFMLKEGGYLILTTPNNYLFQNITGGNWSNQPIENVKTYLEIKKLIRARFKIIYSKTIICNYGDRGVYKIINNKYVVGLFNVLGLKNLRETLIEKSGLAAHTVILAQKITR